MKKLKIVAYMAICVFGVFSCGSIDYSERAEQFVATLNNSACLLAVNDNPEKAYPLVAYSENGVIKIIDLKKQKLVYEQITNGIAVNVLPNYLIWGKSYVCNGEQVAPCNSNVLIFASYYPGTHVNTGEIYVFKIDENGKGQFYKDSEGTVLIDTYDPSLRNCIVSFVCDSDSKVTKYLPEGRYDITGNTVGKYLTENQIMEEYIRKIYHNQVVFYTKFLDDNLYCYSSIFDRTTVYPDCYATFTNGNSYLFYEKKPDSGGRELVMVDPLSLYSTTLASGQSISCGLLDSYITVKGYDLSERYFTFDGEEIYDISEYNKKEVIDAVSSVWDGIMNLFQ